ncbi:vomeronasal type-2 receptor 26-like [Rhinatrema bivittatum]|uniref:vomeronasal type-2 receptor 26-like n=1 Tax=Rhinatrema bivittatum TaxID=194408 RepID=UPI001128FAE6|nr:vomeronasal type-2 receptor 26-like [Rhinatrema bivittatum]
MSSSVFMFVGSGVFLENSESIKGFNREAWKVLCILIDGGADPSFASKAETTLLQSPVQLEKPLTSLSIRPRMPDLELLLLTDAKECMKCPEDQWPAKRQDGCQKKTIEFLSYVEPLGMVLAVISVLGALMPASILVIFIQNRNTPVVKANNRELSYLLLLALILSFGCSLVFIGHPTTLTCMVQQMTFGIVFAICISCLLAKTIMVVIAFKATKPTSNLKLLMGPRLSNALVLSCSLIQVLICVTWLIVAPPFYQMNMKSQMGKIVLECNEGSLFAFCLMLGYMGLLSIISFIVAFLARRLPDSFNEAKFITFSMLIFIAVWLSFIPAYLSTAGKYTVAVEIFAILTSSVGLLGCIFFPKCYIILIRPDMNTKEFLMGKAPGSLKKSK